MSVTFYLVAGHGRNGRFSRLGRGRRPTGSETCSGPGIGKSVVDKRSIQLAWWTKIGFECFDARPTFHIVGTVSGP